MRNEAETSQRDNRPASRPASDSASAAYPVRTDFRRRVVCILGMPFDVVTLQEAVQKVSDAATHDERCFLSTPNLNFTVAGMEGGAAADVFRDSVLRSDLSVADGMPLVWIARLLGLPIRERVAGSTLFEALRHGEARRTNAGLLSV